MQPNHSAETAQANLEGPKRFKWLVSTITFLIAAMFGWGWHVQAASAAETLSNSTFQIQTGNYGEIASFKLTGDTFPTEYVMNAANTKKQNTPDHQWVGELMFTYRLDGGAWTKAWTNKSDDGRTISKSGDEITVTYENAANPEGVRNFKVVEKYALIDDYVKWSIEVVNTSGKTLEIGDLGMPLPFNEYWTGGDEIYETRVLNHSYVSNNGSYMTIGRASGVGPSLLLLPDDATGAGWEYQDRWRLQDHPGSTWSNDESINGGWPEGLNVYYIHSNVIKSTNSGYLPNTSLILQPGESKAYAFKFFEVADDNAVKARLYSEGLIDVTVVPGMIFPTGTKAKFDLHTAKDIVSVEAQYPDETTLADLGEVQPDHRQYELELRHLGQNDITVHYGNGEKTVLQFYAIESIADALQRHATFMVANTQWDAPGTIKDKVFDDWMMQTKAKRGNFNGYWGWGDDWGLTHGQFLAEKNARSPVADEVEALDAYLDVAIWTNLMAGHHEDFLVRDFLNTDVLYRGYAYPHIYNTYFSMYKIAKLYPDLIDYKETADTYLMRAYGIFKALYDGPVSYNWQTGLMGESTTPEIIQALREAGHLAEANDLTVKMATKYDNFKNTKYPYGSEYSYDNTGEEAVYTLAKMNGNVSMMNKINAKTRATRGQMPVWYYYADPVTITGENWWNFQYSVSLVGAAMDDWVRNHSANPEVDQRMSYAAKIANVGAINSGQISSDPANIGASSWTYQAEKGNYGAEGLDGGPLFNGWRGMTGESDLGLFGAIRILSADVSRDPLFGLTGYGAEVTETPDFYEITPQDGVFQRLNLITEKLGIELERDQYTFAKVAKAKNGVKLEMKNVTPGKAHTTRIAFRGLKKATYNVLVNGESQGKWNAYSAEAVPTIDAGSAAAYTVELQEGVADPNAAPAVNAGADIAAALPDEFELNGQASDDGLPEGTISTTWSLASGPAGETATIADPQALSTSVSVTKEGKYVFKLTASDSELTSEDTVTVTVAPAPPIPEVVADYHFDEANGTAAADASGNGKDGELKGGASRTAGRSNLAVSLNGTDGYVKLPAGIVSRLDQFTIATWVKANALGNYNRIFDFGSGTNTYMFLTPQVGGNMRFVISKNGNATGAEQSINGPALPVGVWKHVAITFSGTTGILYVDGVEAGRNANLTLKPSDLGKTVNNYLGKSQFADPYFNGALDNFTIYSRALGAGEIAALVAPPVEDIASFVPIQVATPARTKPVLPSTATANLKDGGTLAVAVAWAAIEPAQYAEPGAQFTVQGTVVGTELTVTAQVTVTGTVIDPYPALVARYNLDDGSGTAVADASGNGYNAEIKGTLNWVEDGHAGGALAFGDSDTAGGNYLDLGKSAALQPGSITLSYWIKRTESINGAENVLLWFKPDAAYNANGLFITYNGDNSSYVVVDGFNSFYVAQSPDDFLPLNEWTHVAITFDATTKAGAIYKNGIAQEIEIEGTPNSITPTSNNKKIGVSGYDNGAQLHAQLDDFRIYSGAMTAKQILGMYEGKDISALDPVQVSTPAGTPPALPDTVGVKYESGGKGTAAVVWEAIEPEKYGAEGAFTVEGSVEGTTLKATAQVTVTTAAAVIERLKPVNVATLVGEAPVLPSVVTAVYSDGSEVRLPVAWDTVSPSSYAKEGSFTIEGAVEGTSIKAVAAVTVNRAADNPGPVTVTPPASEPADPSLLVVTAEQLLADANGDRKLSLKNGQTGVVLPLNIATVLQDKPLIVTNGQWTVELPSSVLKSIPNESGESTNGFRIVFQVRPVQAAALANTNAGLWKSSGDAFEFKLALLRQDGTTKEWTSFAAPVRVQLPYDPAKVNEHTLGIYRWNEDKQTWDRVGGTLDKEKHLIAAELGHFSKYGALSFDRTFADLPSTHWALEAVQALAARGIVNGVDVDRFSPAAQTTRAEFAALLVRAFGLKPGDRPLPFQDVSAKSWYADEVAAAYEAGWINGVTASAFEPDAIVTREQMAVMIVKAYERMSGTVDGGDSAAAPSDADAVSTWAKDAVAKSLTLGLLKGKGEGRFDPAGRTTRAEAAEVVYRLLQQVQKN